MLSQNEFKYIEHQKFQRPSPKIKYKSVIVRQPLWLHAAAAAATTTKIHSTRNEKKLHFQRTQIQLFRCRYWEDVNAARFSNSCFVPQRLRCWCSGTNFENPFSPITFTVNYNQLEIYPILLSQNEFEYMAHQKLRRPSTSFKIKKDHNKTLKNLPLMYWSFYW